MKYRANKKYALRRQRRRRRDPHQNTICPYVGEGGVGGGGVALESSTYFLQHTSYVPQHSHETAK